MPIHDWARIRAGTFHYFHQRWIQAIGDALNNGGLPVFPPAGSAVHLASYCAATNPAAYVENVGVGEAMPDMPLFLTEDRYVPCPLERTYQETWNVFPQHLRTRIENPPAG